MNLTVTPNVNTKKHPSFGLISITNPVGRGWEIAIAQAEPNEVYVEGFLSFTSEHAQDVVNKVRDFGTEVLKPRYYDGLKEKLLLILNDAKKRLPLFRKEDAKAVELLIRNPNPTESRQMFIHDELIFGDIDK